MAEKNKKIPGDPKVVATNGRYDVIKRGSYYCLLRKGESIKTIRRWKGKELLHSMLIKGEYDEVDPPQDYTEE